MKAIRLADGSVRVRCPAKLNLYLAVTGRFPDGYHAVETLMQTVSLWDELRLRPARAGVRLHCSDPRLPADGTNLVVRAAEAFRARFGGPGVELWLTKSIPQGAGLGGGSSDAAGTLLGMLALTGASCTPAALAEVAAGLGADVPFFLHGGTAICRGRGQEVEPLPAGPPMHYVLAMPQGPLPTARVYAALRDAERAGLTVAGPSLTILRDAVAGGDAQAAAQGLHNGLFPAALRLAPSLAAPLDALRAMGCLGVAMSGSGSCLFGLCAGEAQAQAVAARAEARWAGRVQHVLGPAECVEEAP